MRVHRNSEQNEGVSQRVCHIENRREHKEEKLDLPGVGESQEHKL